MNVPAKLAVALLLSASALAQRPAKVAVYVAWGIAATVDVGLTQSCIRAGRCREGNPMLPQSAWGMSSVAGAETGASMWEFHRWRGRKIRWLIPVANIAAHAVGIWSYAR